MPATNSALLNAFQQSKTPLVTLSLFGFSGMQKIWAFTQMGLGRRHLQDVTGLRFWKLLGTGKGLGFSMAPNWGRYGFLGVWDSLQEADQFLQNSAFSQAYSSHAFEQWTVKLIPIKSKGKWSGKQPFSPVFAATEFIDDSTRLAVLTRASLNIKSLTRFWSHVPLTSRSIGKARGLILSTGLGEAPFIHQATFSTWKNKQVMQDFAYKNEVHKKVIQKTRAENWYAEDLFARFLILDARGSWHGSNPLKEKAP